MVFKGLADLISGGFVSLGLNLKVYLFFKVRSDICELPVSYMKENFREEKCQ